MIVKLVLHNDKKAFSVWSPEGKRLYWSDKPKDLELCFKLLTVNKKPTDAQVAQSIMNKTPIVPETELRQVSYFNAKWVKGVVTMVKRAQGYSW